MERPLTVTRRRFLAGAGLGLMGLAQGCAQPSTKVQGLVLQVDDPWDAATLPDRPVEFTIPPAQPLVAAARADRLQLEEVTLRASGTTRLWVQAEPGSRPDAPVRLWFRLPPGRRGMRRFRLVAARTKPQPTMCASRDAETGRYTLSENEQVCLRYNYQTVEPGEVLESVAESNRKYARARSDYIHPLYGLHNEELTQDWSVDHPHHRGIYWAWPEVDWRGERADLHALQGVFARPTGNAMVSSGRLFAELRAENLWKWNDRIPIIRESATIRVWAVRESERLIDLRFRFEALGDDVAVARRETDAYGGLNLRCAGIQNQEIVKHLGPSSPSPRIAWGEISGRFGGASGDSSLVILQHLDNPRYPGEWVDYPELNWLQPTFPARGERFVITQSAPLVLQFRLCIRANGSMPRSSARQQWQAYNLRPKTVISTSADIPDE